MYVVYEKESTRIIAKLNGSPRNEPSQYPTLRSARAALTRFVNRQVVYTRDDLAIAERGEFRNSIEKKRVVKNLMTGVEVEISVNTPLCLDPSSETFWSM